MISFLDDLEIIFLGLTLGYMVQALITQRNLEDVEIIICALIAIIGYALSLN